MREVEIPFELRAVIPSGSDDKISLTIPLQLFFHFLIRENFRDFDPDNATDIYLNPVRFNKNDTRYQDLASDISISIKAPRYITKSYLRNLAFPDKNEWTKRRSKLKLITIYNYLNNHIAHKKLEFARFCWTKKVKEQFPNFFEVKNLKPSANPVDVNFKGSKFVNASICGTQIYTRTDFYLAKHINKCQWYGVLNGWDVEREDYSKINQIVFQSFKDPESCTVVAVVCGPSGSGKSTLLRRLAIDCMYCDFYTLWVTNLGAFSGEIDRIESNPGKNYLLIIEDWEKLKGQSASAFLNEASTIQNLRIIIGDFGNIINKEYYEYLDENNVFDLLAKENEAILKEILFNVSDWLETSEDILKPEFYSSPLYIILFVLGRVSQMKDKSFLKAGIKEQFQSIIASDLRRINALYPKLAKALYYWSWIYNEYKDRAMITWEALLDIAEFDNKTKKRFKKLNKTNPIGEILSYYISLEMFVHPEIEGSHIFRFHHELLAQGMLQKIDQDWYFDDSVKIEILEILIEKEAVHSASSLISAYEFEILDNGNLGIYRGIQAYEELDSLLMWDAEIREIYTAVETITSERYWKDTIRSLMSYVYFGIFFPCYVVEIIKTVIAKGCMSKHVHEAHELILADGDDSLKGLRKKYPFRPKHVDITDIS